MQHFDIFQAFAESIEQFKIQFFLIKKKNQFFFSA